MDKSRVVHHPQLRRHGKDIGSINYQAKVKEDKWKDKRSSATIANWYFISGDLVTMVTKVPFCRQMGRIVVDLLMQPALFLLVFLWTCFNGNG